MCSGSLTLIRQPIWEKKDSEFKPVKLRWNIDLVSHPDQLEESINSYNVDAVQHFSHFAREYSLGNMITAVVRSR